MRIVKEALGGEGAALAPGDLELIGQLARRPLSPEEVYTFSVRLCDNEVDRDFDRFDPLTLEERATMFVGKSGIFDHQWSARGQAARIYRTEVVYEPERPTRTGDHYCWLKDYAYMVRTEGNRDLIAEIEGGIKKEVSVGCSVERAVCSICGADRNQGDCGHVKGQEYGGQLCYASLEGASDAYEFSFVAVPAQPRAGVVKGAGSPYPLIGLKELVRGNPRCVLALEELEAEAQLGRKYLDGLREDVVRLALLADRELDSRAIKSLAMKLSPAELEEMAKSYARRAGEKYPLKTQLEYGERPAVSNSADQAFLV